MKDLHKLLNLSPDGLHEYELTDTKNENCPSIAGDFVVPKSWILERRWFKDPVFQVVSDDRGIVLGNKGVRNLKVKNSSKGTVDSVASSFFLLQPADREPGNQVGQKAFYIPRRLIDIEQRLFSIVGDRTEEAGSGLQRRTIRLSTGKFHIDCDPKHVFIIREIPHLNSLHTPQQILQKNFSRPSSGGPNII